MSTAEDPERPPPDRPPPYRAPSDRPPTGPGGAAPRRNRLLIAGVVLGAVVLVIAFMLLVSQCGTGDDSEIYGATSVAGTAGVSVVQ
jgi:hypothetical protein